jgi:SPP1 family phage portal protein
MAAPFDFKQLITEHEPIRAQMIADYNAYCAEGLKISSRTMPDTSKINNKLINDFRGEIVDQITGYLFGKPVTYSLDKEAYESTGGSYEVDNEEFDDFKLRCELADLDAEAGKQAAMMGSCARICYTNDEGQVSIDNMFPWQVVFIDASNAFIYSTVQTEGEAQRYVVQHYDDTFITTYLEADDGEFVEQSQEPHLFGLMPIIEIVNNDEKLPAFRKVESLIDAYDRTLSDAQNEVEEFRQAYMVFINADIDSDTVALARASGAFGLGEDADAKFLTKEINDAFLEHHKQTLRENIYRFSATVDMTDQKFSGADQSGEARKWKLLALENKAAILERKFARALRQQFKVLSTAWQTLGFSIDWKSINFNFDRNIPLELSMEATTTAALKGMVSERTRLSQLSIVDDVEREIEEMEQEQAVDLDSFNAEGEGEGEEEDKTP